MISRQAGMSAKPAAANLAAALTAAPKPVKIGSGGHGRLESLQNHITEGRESRAEDRETIGDTRPKGRVAGPSAVAEAASSEAQREAGLTSPDVPGDLVQRLGVRHRLHPNQNIEGV
jgi:hypothetical protein